MKSKISACLITILLFLLSCNNPAYNSDAGVFIQDFDNLKYWTGSPILTDKKAHTGRYSTFTDSLHEFSQTFKLDMDYILSKKYKTVNITAWCFQEKVKNEIKFVTSIEYDSGIKPLYYDPIALSSFVKDNIIWYQVKKTLKLPQGGLHDSFLKVYLWSPKKELSFMDDVEIRFE